MSVAVASHDYVVPLKNSEDDEERVAAVPAATKGGRSDVPELYAAALSRRWNVVTSRAQTEPHEASYADPTDGLTALHLAVISRTTPTNVSYRRGGKTSTRLRDSSGAEVAGTRRIKCPAPMNTVRALLLAYPDGALAQCLRYGYTPLAYACHVPPPDKESLEAEDDEENYTVYTHGTRSTVYQSVFRDSYGILDECEKLVRLIMNYRPDCASVLSRDGLSPLDLHIMSYSVGWGYEHEKESAGRTNTGVLRTLLEEDPALARSRPRGSGGGESIGPLEVLYKYNAPSFIKVLQSQDSTVRVVQVSDASRSARRAKKAWYEELDPGSGAGSGSGSGGSKASGTRQTLSSWWVWKWSILLLKYLHHRRGSKFQAVHAASSAPGCPLPLLMLAVRAFPNQIRETDDMSGNGNLPLHIVASWGLPPAVGEEDDARVTARLAAAADPIASRTKPMVLSELLTEYPAAARVRNAAGRTPLGLLVESGGMWNGGVRRLVRAYPDALTARDRTTGLMPFMAAAAACSAERGGGGGGGPSSGADLRGLQTVYELLRADPRALRPMKSSKGKGKGKDRRRSAKRR